MARKLTAYQRLERILDDGLSSSWDLLSASATLALQGQAQRSFDDDDDDDDDAIVEHARALILERARSALDQAERSITAGPASDSVGRLAAVRRAREERQARREAASGIVPPTRSENPPDLADAIRRAMSGFEETI